jgi:sterol desaturase/sphingolipid hydroxylase (fatty acid hydroxylase superfamily)
MDGDLSHLLLNLAPRVVARLIGPFTEFLLHDSLIWWPFLLSTLGIGAFAFWLRDRRGLESLREFRRRYLSRAIWAHRSAQADYAFYIVNGVLYPLIVAPLVLSGAGIAKALNAGLGDVFGTPAAPLVGSTAARVAYTLIFFAAYDFGRFVAHNLLHEIPLLWEFHKTHHSAEVLTPISSYRVHPVDLFVMQLCPNLATGLVSGVFFYLCAGEIGFYSFLGLHVCVAACNTIGNLRHWHVWISFGPVLGRWLISPAHHQVHHSLEPRHMGKNRGFELAIWDRMFGSLYVPAAEETLRLGLGDGSDGEWHMVGRLYAWPFRYALARLGFVRAPRPEEKMR